MPSKRGMDSSAYYNAVTKLSPMQGMRQFQPGTVRMTPWKMTGRNPQHRLHSRRCQVWDRNLPQQAYSIKQRSKKGDTKHDVTILGWAEQKVVDAWPCKAHQDSARLLVQTQLERPPKRECAHQSQTTQNSWHAVRTCSPRLVLYKPQWGLSYLAHRHIPQLPAMC